MSLLAAMWLICVAVVVVVDDDVVVMMLSLLLLQSYVLYTSNYQVVMIISFRNGLTL